MTHFTWIDISGLDERNYDERVGEGHHMRSLARSTLSRALSRLSSESGSRRPPLGAHHPRGVSTGTGSGGNYLYFITCQMKAFTVATCTLSRFFSVGTGSGSKYSDFKTRQIKAFI